MFNELGEVVGIAFQSYAGSDAENIGYVIPTPGELFGSRRLARSSLLAGRGAGPGLAAFEGARIRTDTPHTSHTI